MAENGAVEFVFGKVAEVVVDVFGGNFEGVVEGLPFGEFREGRGAGDGGSAAVGFPAEIFDCVGFGVDLNKHLHLVAADGITDEANGVVFELFFVTHQEVAGVQKVFFDDIGINPILTLLHKSIIT